MFLQGLEKPGIAKGYYPEKQQEDWTWTERLGNKIERSLKSHSASTLTQARKFVRQVDQEGKTFLKKTDKELSASTREIRQALHRSGFQADTVTRCFALIRETAARTLKMRPWDVQVLGGWALLEGMVAEMETGQGKTLTATLPACTAALGGVPVHIITANDYLVTRDAGWMEPLYRALGLGVGTITGGMEFAERQASYQCEITYCSNKQVAFDYLRDRLILSGKESRLQMQIDRLADEESRSKKLLLRGLCFGIIDEVDTVLIDDARTPLMISKSADESDFEEIYHQAYDVAGKLMPHDDFVIEDHLKRIDLTAKGKFRVVELTEEFGGMWQGVKRGQDLVTQALTAIHGFVRDRHYQVQDDRIHILDRLDAPNRSDKTWERGLIHMLEVKEDCPLSGMRETLAKISYQYFFNRYLRLAGMTASAREVREELETVYHLGLLKIPPHRPSERIHHPTRVFMNAEDKWNAVVNRVRELNKQKTPVLIGTRKPASTELIHSLLTKQGLTPYVLSGADAGADATLIQETGRPGQITIAMNMAGRGVDLKVASTVLQRGGLHVILSEPHESHRLDRQLIQQCGRQGTPGSYELFLSLDDEMVRNFGPGYLVIWCKIIKTIFQATGSGVGEHLVLRSQQGMERYYSKIRMRLTELDKQMNKVLAFSGRS